jgi:hypothetical protein
MFLPPKQPSDINKQVTDHLQLHSMLRGCRRVSCVLAETARAAPVDGVVLVAARCSGHTFDCFHESNSSAPLLSVCSAAWLGHLSEYSNKEIHLLRC